MLTIHHNTGAKASSPKTIKLLEKKIPEGSFILDPSGINHLYTYKPTEANYIKATIGKVLENKEIASIHSFCTGWYENRKLSKEIYGGDEVGSLSVYCYNKDAQHFLYAACLMAKLELGFEWIFATTSIYDYAGELVKQLEDFGFELQCKPPNPNYKGRGFGVYRFNLKEWNPDVF